MNDIDIGGKQNYGCGGGVCGVVDDKWPNWLKYKCRKTQKSLRNVKKKQQIKVISWGMIAIFLFCIIAIKKTRTLVPAYCHLN